MTSGPGEGEGGASVGSQTGLPLEQAASAGRPERRTGGALTSIRFRLAALWSIVLFGLSTSAMVLIYVGVVQGVDQQSLADLREVPSVFESNGLQPALRSELRDLEASVDREVTDQVRRAFFIGLSGMFVVSLGVGWLVAGWLLRPVDRITAVAREIQVTDLSRRIDLPGPDDELGRLADTFDEMLDRLEAAFTHQLRFVQEASHELRNPLAVMRTNLDVALSAPTADAGELRQAAEVVGRAVERMSKVVDDLVLVARHEQPSAEHVAVDLRRLAAEEADGFGRPAAVRSLRIVVDAPAPVVARGDEQAIRQVVANLLDNAVRLAPAGTTVLVRVRSQGDEVVLEVADEGPGIAIEDQPKVFQRFWRGSAADGARTRSGLGLAIVRQIVEAHGGTVELASQLGQGSTFRVRLRSA